MYKVYVKTDESGIVTAINSSAFLSDTSDWTEIDSGTGDKYHHAQGNYLPLGLTDEDGIYNYKLSDGILTERTVGEKAVDLSAAVPPLTLEMLAECVMEMSEFIYG